MHTHVQKAAQKIGDPEFQALWKDLQRYRRDLNALGMKDMHIESPDDLSAIATELRSMARTDILRTMVLAPLSVLGTVAHSPIMALAHVVGRRYA